MIRVFVAEDQALVRRGLLSLLDMAPQIEVVGDAADGEEALHALKSLESAGAPAEVLLLDIRMPSLSGLDVLRRLPKGSVRVLVLTTFLDEQALVEALKLGAAGYLLKDATFEELVDAIAAVARGDRAVKPVTLSRILDATYADSTDPPATLSLTAREKEILRLLAAGLSNREIAIGLENAEGTVKNHVSNILSKMGVRDRTQAVLLALQMRLI
ncbi:MAG: response regulator [Myxococcota bacterium]